MTASSRLLHFARELQRASTFGELLLVTRDEVEATLGYKHVWVFVAESPDAKEARLLDVAGAIANKVIELAPVIPITGDAMMEEILRGDAIVVVEDARTDARTNKAIVETLGNRTIINVALRLVDEPIAVLGMGTFGDEGCRAPSEAMLEHLHGMASQLAVAAARIRLGEERRRAEVARREADARHADALRLDAVGRLAANVAHDFNNLLAIIVGHASELRDGASPGERRGVDAILDAAERAAVLTRQMLAFGRRQVLTPRVVCPHTVVSELVRVMAELMGAHIVTDLQLAPEPWCTIVDPGLLEQVISSLAVNARDAMPEGGRLTLATRNVADGGPGHAGPHVCIAVSDTGRGLSETERLHVFDPFYARDGEGAMGLGLSSVFGAVTQSGGFLRVVSEPGAGSTFEVYFPRALGDAAARPATGHVAPPEPALAKPAGPEVVLIVEDEPLVREVAARVLGRAGYHVIAAADGPAALAASDAHAGHLHLLLSDVVMEPMSGPELASELTRRRPDTRVLFMSGYPLEVIARREHLEPTVSYLHKPFTPERLRDAVRAALGRELTARA